jgi:hypothetical protein
MLVFNRLRGAILRSSKMLLELNAGQLEHLLNLLSTSDLVFWLGQVNTLVSKEVDSHTIDIRSRK